MTRSSLRRAEKRDVQIVRDITCAAYEHYIPIIGRKPMPMVADYDHAITAHMIDLYNHDQKTVALIECILRPTDIIIENIAVLPDYQGKGVGAILLTHAETLARTHNRNRIELYTNALMTDNIRYYTKHGYAIYKREPFPKGGTVIYMRKDLRPND